MTRTYCWPFEIFGFALARLTSSVASRTLGISTPRLQRPQGAMGLGCGWQGLGFGLAGPDAFMVTSRKRSRPSPIAQQGPIKHSLRYGSFEASVRCQGPKYASMKFVPRTLITIPNVEGLVARNWVPWTQKELDDTLPI